MIRKHTPLEPIGRRCKVDGCDETARRLKSTICHKHYYRIKKYGDPDAMHLLRKKRTESDKIENKASIGINNTRL